MSEGLLMVGIFGVLCGIFGLCLSVVILLILVGKRYWYEGQEERCVLPTAGNGLESKIDKAILKQWDNLLGYNGNEGDELDG